MRRLSLDIDLESNLGSSEHGSRSTKRLSVDSNLGSSKHGPTRRMSTATDSNHLGSSLHSLSTSRHSFLLRRHSSLGFDMQALGLDDELPNVSLFQLDHKAGRIDGKDIILSTLLFIITTARSSIDIMFGYLQLFPVLKNALEHALARDVTVRVFTNNAETSDLFFMNNIFSESFASLLQMGAKVYVPNKTNSTNLCVHTKSVLVDSRVLLLGSWNCLSFSVFYEEEFSVLLMADEEESEVFMPVKRFNDSLVNTGNFSELVEAPPKVPFPLYVYMNMSKYGRRMVEKGF